jgi:dTDP-4-amino-4,6-dideoxygalactose transaminase
MSIKNIFVTKPSMPSLFGFISLIIPLWSSRNLTNSGRIHNELENTIKSLLKVKHFNLFTNGHIALETAIKVLNLNGEVITTPFTFASTTQAIINCGLKPVFCDIYLDDFTINAEKIREKITLKTSAILAVHVFGNICNVEAIKSIAEEFNLKVIYDAAHAFGTLYDEKPISNYGDMVMYSFHATKVFHTVEGGGLAFGSNIDKERVVSFRNFGITPEGSIIPGGTNGKMSEFHASMGLLNLKGLKEEIKKRTNIAHTYDYHLSKINGIEVPKLNKRGDSNHSYYVILVTSKNKKRDGLFDFLHSKGVIARKYFYPLTTKIYDQTNDEPSVKYNLPVANYVVERTIALPIYGTLKKAELNYVIRCIKEYMES